MATTRELIDRLRRDIDDQIEPYYCSDDDLVEFLNRAIDEACLRARLILDSDTPDICNIELRPTFTKYSIDDRLLGVKRAIVSGQDRPLGQLNMEVMDNNNPGWEQETAKIPTKFLFDMDACWLRVYPTPTVAGQINMTVWRTQLNEVNLTNDPNGKPEIHRIHHYNLLDYAKYLVYSTHDSDMFDPDAAAKAKVQFAANFGQRRDASTLEILRRDRLTRVKAHFS